MKTKCEICPHNCVLNEGKIGICKARKNSGGIIICVNYGKVTSIALDPIEKKPLYRFYPGSKILSIGSYGCNLRCPFCQNSDIAMVNGDQIETKYVEPVIIIEKALELMPQGNIGIAYTYNEPLVGYEYVLDCSKLARKQNLKNVVVTNGTICERPLTELLPFIDAMNIDLKGFSNRFYKMIDGDFETVKQTIKLAETKCHVEITTLIVPGENDSEVEIDELAQWLSSVNSNIPLHITRFFPRWKMTDRDATSVETIFELANIARRYLKYVYEGNC
ncbi:MAG: AmmeMemoRadiSam system radical SAM enzyme [Eubacteriales bacterium]